MASTPGGQDGAVSDLRDFQIAFLQRFFQPGAASSQLLVSPTGLGKTHTCAAIVSRQLAQPDVSRVLILAPAAVRHVWADLLSQMSGKGSALVVDRPHFRELQAAVPPGESPWPAAAVVMSIETAERPDVVTSLCAVQWDLVVIEEVDSLSGQRRQLLEALVANRAARRLLMLTVAPVGDWLHDMLPEVEITNWSDEATRLLKSLGGGGTQLTRRVICYTRSDEERAFLVALREFLDQLPDEPAGRLARRVVLTRASSSLLAVERTLVRISRNLESADGEAAQVVAALLGSEGEAEGQADNEAGAHAFRRSPFERIHEAHLRTMALLESLARVDSDARMTALLGCVQQLASEHNDAPVCLYTSFADTANYVTESIEGSGIRCSLLTGSARHESRRTAIQQLRDRGGLLVATSASLEGFDLSFVQHVVHYDLPLGKRGMQARMGRVDRIGRTSPCTVYVFRDKSEVLPIETEFFETHASG